MNRNIKKVTAILILIAMTFYTMPIFAFTNEETVYSKLKSDGEEYKTIVTTTTDNNGETVNKQEEIDKDLPLDVKITYKLNGEEIKPEELAGKSGKVSINIKYINKSKKTMNINGNTATMYTPFIVAVGTIIDSENNKNVEVSKSGKVVNDGDRTIVVGILMPGLEESLDLSGEFAEIEIPDSIEITMDSENFELSNILTYSSPNIITEDFDFSKFDDLFDNMNKLQDGMNKIIDGSNKLYDGTVELADGTTKLKDGTGKLSSGVTELKNVVSSSISALVNDSSNALDENTLKAISNQAVQTVSKELNAIGDSAEMQAKTNIASQKETIGLKAENGAKSSIEGLKPTIKNQAKEGAINKVNTEKETIGNNAKAQAEVEAKEQIETIANQAVKGTLLDIETKKAGIVSDLKNKIKELLAGNMEAIISGAVSNGTSSMSDTLKSIETEAINEGIKAGTDNVDLSGLDNITADSGNVSLPDIQTNINVNIDINNILANNNEYQALTDEEKAIVDSALSSIKNEAESKAVSSANSQVESIKNNIVENVNSSLAQAKVKAEETAKASAKERINSVANSVIQKSAKASAEASASKVTSSVIPNAVESGAKASAEGIASAVANGAIDDLSGNYISQIAGNVSSSVANGVASQMVGEVASKTAQKTAEQVAGNVAEEVAGNVANSVGEKVANLTAQTVAEEVAGEVASQTAKKVALDVSGQTAYSVADTVANEVKKEATKTVESQMSKLLNEGINPLEAGMKELDNGVITLKTGSEALRDGTKSLVDGLNTFNNDGIKKITNIVNNDLKNSKTRLEKLKELSDEYNTFGSDEQRDGIKFISIIDSIKVSEKDEDKKDVTLTNEDENKEMKDE